MMHFNKAQTRVCLHVLCVTSLSITSLFLRMSTSPPWLYIYIPFPSRLFHHLLWPKQSFKESSLLKVNQI